MNTIGTGHVVDYVDYRNGKSYEFTLRNSQAFRIYRLEIAPENVLRDLWLEWRKTH